MFCVASRQTNNKTLTKFHNQFVLTLNYALSIYVSFLLISCFSPPLCRFAAGGVLGSRKWRRFSYQRGPLSRIRACCDIPDLRNGLGDNCTVSFGHDQDCSCSVIVRVSVVLKRTVGDSD